jgi:hypothetical protein
VAEQLDPLPLVTVTVYVPVVEALGTEATAEVALVIASGPAQE